MLISSCKRTKIATSIDRRTMEPTKKDILHLKKKKLQQDGRRGTNRVKSDHTPARWVTHSLENNNAEKVLSLLWRFQASCQASQPGDLTKGLGIPRESDFEDQQDLITGLPQDWGNTDSTVAGHKQNRVHSKIQGKGAVSPHETEADRSAAVGGFPVEVWVSSGSSWGQEHWRQQSWKTPLV